MTSTSWSCFLCNADHTARPFYEAQSLPSGIYVRCCELGRLMTEPDMQSVADAWLDATIAARSNGKRYLAPWDGPMETVVREPSPDPLSRASRRGMR